MVLFATAINWRVRAPVTDRACRFVVLLLALAATAARGQECHAYTRTCLNETSYHDGHVLVCEPTPVLDFTSFASQQITFEPIKLYQRRDVLLVCAPAGLTNAFRFQLCVLPSVAG